MSGLRATNLPRTAHDIAVVELREAIVRGDLAPGVKIRQDATARELGISVIPVREALKTLAGEGFVTYRPQKGYFVAELQSSAVRDLTRARQVVEGAVDEEAVRRAGPKQFELMRRALDDARRAVADHDAAALIAANRRFHFGLFEACDNEWLVRFVRQLWDAVDPYRALAYRRMEISPDEPALAEEFVGAHGGILAALEAGDAKLAIRLLRENRERSEDFLVGFVDGATAGD